MLAGITPFRPYIVQILCYYQTPFDANNAVAYMGYFGFGANVLLVCSIRSLGKRNVYLYSMAIVVVALFGLGINHVPKIFHFISWKNFNRIYFQGIYGFTYLSLDQISFEINTNTSNFQNSTAPSMKQYLPVVGFGVLQFFSNFGVTSLPNMMISEVFPFKYDLTSIHFQFMFFFAFWFMYFMLIWFKRSRALATGLVTIFNYCTTFLVTKLFYSLEVFLTLPGLAILFGLIGLFG